MTTTYEVTDNEQEQFVVEIKTIEERTTYQKTRLIKEIARLQAILAEFDK